MILAFAIFVFFAALFSALSLGWAKLLFKNPSREQKVLLELAVFAVGLCTSTLLFMLGWPAEWVYPVLVVSGALGWALSYFRRQPKTKPDRQLDGKAKYVKVLTIFPSLLLMGLGSHFTLWGGFSYRHWPDLLGWATASEFINRGGNFTSLVSSVERQLRGTSLVDAMQIPLGVGQTSIGQLPSLSEYVAVDFLVASGRTGGPGFLAALSQLANFDLIQPTLLALCAWAIWLVVRIVAEYGTQRGLEVLSATLFGCLAGLNIGILSVTLEGGFGQTVTLPFFMFVIYAAIKKPFDPRLFIWTMVLLIGVATSTYFNLLFLAVPFVGVCLGMRAAVSRDLKSTSFRNYLYAAGATIVLVAPSAINLLRLIESGFRYGDYGGADQGRSLLPSNLVGVLNALPQSQFLMPTRSLPESLLDILISELILVLLILQFKRPNFAFWTLLLAYTYLTIAVYMHDPVNNYRVWKLTEYAGVIATFLYVDSISDLQLKDASNHAIRQSWKLFSNKLRIVIVTLLALLSMVNTIAWSVTWMQTGRLTLKNSSIEVVESITPTHDVLAACFDYSIFIFEAMSYGDLHLGTFDRGRGPTLSSSPPRPLAIVTPSHPKNTDECNSTIEQIAGEKHLTNKITGDEITIYLESSN